MLVLRTNLEVYIGVGNCRIILLCQNLEARNEERIDIVMVLPATANVKLTMFLSR